MNTRLLQALRSKGIAFRISLFLVLMLIVASLLVFTPTRTLADGGGFPTPTRTPVPPTATSPIPTFAPLPIETATPTLMILLPTQQVFLAVATPTPEPPSGLFSVPVVCWPFAIGLIVVVIIVSVWLLNNREIRMPWENPPPP